MTIFRNTGKHQLADKELWFYDEEHPYVQWSKQSNCFVRVRAEMAASVIYETVTSTVFDAIRK